MKHLVLLTAAFATVGVAAAAQQPQAPEALDGVDTVLLLKTGKETFGKSAFRSTYGSLTYLFASAETKAEFDAAPKKFAVQLDGQCARMRGGATGNPSNYAVVDGKIYVFGSDDCRTRFLAAPAKFMPREAPAMPSAADAVAAGRSLLDRAVQAHGGGALDAMTSYVEVHKASVPAGRPGPPPEIRSTWKFPGGVRSERTFAMGGNAARRATIATLVASGKAWSGMVGSENPMREIHPIGVPDMERSYGWQLMPLLRGRAGNSTSVASLGRGTVQGDTVERVRVKHGGADVTVNLDPATNRAHSLSFVGRNRDGEFGDVTILFSDYRNVDGLLVPFAEKGLFDGTPDDFWTRALDKVEVNAALDPALFQAPVSGGK